MTTPSTASSLRDLDGSSPGPSQGSQAKLGSPGSWNMYAYTSGDPVNRVDPSVTDEVDENDNGDCAGPMACQFIDEGYGDDDFQNDCLGSLLSADGDENPTAAAGVCGAEGYTPTDPTPAGPQPTDFQQGTYGGVACGPGWASPAMEPPSRTLRIRFPGTS